MTHFDVIIIGAGASGLMCAIEAGKRKRKVAVLDHQTGIGKKILISGGGRCNFTNRNLSAGDYLSSNPAFVRSALAGYTPDDIIEFLNHHHIPFIEKNHGQLFCKMPSSAITQALKKSADAHSVRIFLSRKIKLIEKDDRFHLITASEEYTSDSIVIATGGLSYRILGASDLGYRVARQFGLNVIPPAPGLVPFLWNPQDRKRYGELSGISLPVRILMNKRSVSESMLFTHKGISGPAVLDASLFWKPEMPLIIDLLPGVNLDDLLKAHRSSKMLFGNFLSQHLPKRLAQSVLDEELNILPVNQISKKQLLSVSEKIHHWEIHPAGLDDYSLAEVTCGGIDTHELSSKTMESKKIPGLFFTGEVLDVTGRLGGYNLHWAWASGFAAGQTF